MSIEISPERMLVRSLKSAIKAQTTELRAEKAMVKNLQRSYGSSALAQSQLDWHRLEARARFLIYGLLRGRSWETIENNHNPEQPSPARLRTAVKRIWDAQASRVAHETGTLPPFPEVLMPLVQVN